MENIDHRFTPEVGHSDNFKPEAKIWDINKEELDRLGVLEIIDDFLNEIKLPETPPEKLIPIGRLGDIIIENGKSKEMNKEEMSTFIKSVEMVANIESRYNNLITEINKLNRDIQETKKHVNKNF